MTKKLAILGAIAGNIDPRHIEVGFSIYFELSH